MIHKIADFLLEHDGEVPNIFRELGYPVTIKASTMQTIGASHSWPTLLAALTWLIDLVSTIKSLEGQAGQQLLLGGDNSSGKVTLLRQWYEQQEDIDGQLRSVQATLVQIQKECAELEADKGNEMKIREDIARMEDDIRKATNYKNEMEADEEQLTAALKNVEQDFSVVRNQVDELRAKVENQKRIIADQATGERGIKGSDARAIMVEYDQNKMYLRELQGEMEELSKEHWLNVPKANNTFTQEQSRYLKILSEVKNIRTEVLKEDTSFFECAPKDIRALQSAVAKDSKNILDDTRNELENAMRTTECAIKAAQQRKENVVGTAQVEQEKLSERERMESRAERQRKREKEEWLKERQILEGEIGITDTKNIFVTNGLENQKEILENKQHEIGALEQASFVSILTYLWVAEMSTGTQQLSADDKERIARNKAEAIKRAAARKEREAAVVHAAKSLASVQINRPQVFFSPFHMAILDAIKSIPSRHYDEREKMWSLSINDLKIADKVLSSLMVVDVTIDSIPENVVRLLTTDEQYKEGVPNDLSYVIDPTLLNKLFPYQRKGVSYGIEKRGRVLIADEMGLGKSVQALTIARYYK
uniref:Kinetochore protein NDC80 n=1 Tax=Heterorhabditis bacteriophora TaxID=37862 RepID=A0A1I7XAD9_HETBA